MIDKDDYKNEVKKNINQEYKIESAENVDKVTKKHANIVTKLGIEERVFKTIPREAFITVKDHKEDFPNNIKCRLINLAKPDIGKVSKQILENAIFVIKSKTAFNHWRNTQEVIAWFQNIKNKKKKTFINFDICSFYPSITPKLLTDALNWAEGFLEISDDDKEAIFESKKSFLYTGDTVWVKKGEINFDVGMGAWDGAETCELVGLYILDHLKKRLKDFEPGLYRDDSLGVIEATPRIAEKTRQKIHSIMAELGLKITSKANIKVVEFLDVVFDLQNENYRPFLKPGDRPLYVNKKSNHPPSILKNIPLAVNKRLCDISSSKDVFDQSVPVYQAALDRAGYNHKLEYHEPNQSKKRKRKKKIIWFNPPFSMRLKTNIGRKFLALIDKHFPKGHMLYLLINRYKVKLSYRCLPNMGAIISQHNSKILRPEPAELRCRCREKTTCPMPGKCATDKLVYRATVKTELKTETYVGLTMNQFKDRWKIHDDDFSDPARRNQTVLSSYIWDLKDNGTPYTINWELVRRAQPFSPITRKCDLCIAEIMEIIYNPGLASLNKRNELFNHCRHRDKVLLVKRKRRKRIPGD